MTFTNYPLATKEQVSTAIESALKAKQSWQDTPFVDRVAIFQRAAELVTTKYRYDLIAATMLGQGKNVWQGEIDAAAELADFFRLNCNYAAEILEKQPDRGSDGMWSRVDYRPLEGFVYAVSPFNFTALGGSLISGPALLGNVVLWKPSQYNIYPSTIIYNILVEAGLPPDVIQFVPGDAAEITDIVLQHREFAGLNFIGSSDVFRSIYGKIGQGIAEKRYRDFPRIVGETSGKNFHLIHPTADIPSAVNHTIRGAFEYQGQKCSATSRAYVPESRAKEFIEGLQAGIKEITIGNPDKDFEAFMGPVIHRRSFDKIKSIIDESNKDPSVKVIAGGKYDGSVGFFVEPTVYQVDDPNHKLFNEEIFGPVLAVHVYPDAEWKPLLQKIDKNGGGLALTGAVFANNRSALREAEDTLRYSAGNFYLSKFSFYTLTFTILTAFQTARPPPPSSASSPSVVPEAQALAIALAAQTSSDASLLPDSSRRSSLSRRSSCTPATSRYRTLHVEVYEKRRFSVNKRVKQGTFLCLILHRDLIISTSLHRIDHPPLQPFHCY